jgi:murein DD-endopeptidase MepM/ murein hydrolase activator NlpD
MDKNQKFLQRYGGHLALVIVAILFYIGARMAPLGDLLDRAIGEESGVITDSSMAADEGILNLDRTQAQSGDTIDISDVPILFDNSLSPSLDPFTFEGKKPEHHFITYTVKPNDTPIGIAEQFGIKPETLLGGNPFLSEEASALQPGNVLTILPEDGVLHDVLPGESLEGLSELYGVPMEDIIAYEPNNLEFPYRLYPDTQIMVPGGVRDVWFWSAPQLPQRTGTSDSVGSGIAAQVQGTGVFIWPVGYRRITQHFWYGHPAIDIGLPEGNSVVASDTGTVTWAGWNVYGYGNLVVINHGNGYETYYAHLSGINVFPGQVVNQGQVIGLSGNTGRSSGPHLHFEIRYFNSMLEPLAYLR